MVDPPARKVLTTGMPACMLAINGRYNHQDDHRGGSGAYGAIQEEGETWRPGKGAKALG